jgi:LuxR family maltose regulon positive regulatory protein
LTFLIQNLPAHLHLYLISRTEPPLPLAQLRVRGQLLELDAQDLRFTTEESQAFLAEVMGLELSPEIFSDLNSRAEGWIAGLELAALAMKRGRVQFGTHRLIEDYLAEQVLNRQTPAVRQFLLETSILKTLTGPLCDALVYRRWRKKGSGQSSKSKIRSSMMLKRLERANLFLVPLDSECSRYRYHPLFAEFLQQRLRETSLDHWADLHLRAAEWYESAGLQEEAVEHALEGGDYYLAARLIEKVASLVYHRNEILTILNWMKALPESVLFSRPKLSLQYAWAMALHGQLAAVEPVLDRVSATLSESDQTVGGFQFEERSTQVQALRGEIDDLRSYLARLNGKISEAISLSQRSLDKTEPNQHYERGIRLILLGRAQFLDGEIEPARQNLMEALQLTRLVEPELGYLSAVHYLAELYRVQGRLHRAYALYKGAEAYLVKCERPFLGGVEQIGIGELLCEWNDLEGASGYIHAGLHLAEQSGDYVFLRDACLACTRLESTRGRYQEAEAALQRAENLVAQSQDTLNLPLVIAWRGRLLLAKEDLIGLEAWLHTCELSPFDELSFVKEFGHITLAWVLLALGRLDEARLLVSRLISAAKAGQRKGRVIELFLLQALLYSAEQKTSQALKSLKVVLGLAGPEGYLTTFLEGGAPLAALVRQLYRSSLETGYHPAWKRSGERQDLKIPSFHSGEFDETRFALRLVKEFARKGLPGGDLSSDDGTNQSLVSPLSDREIQVLRLIAAGKSYQEISQELQVALSTVQTHVKHAYNKLDAHNGLEATARARQLNLIP